MGGVQVNDVVQAWAEWIAGLRSGAERVPPAVEEGAAIRTADVLGCAVAGLRTPEIAAILRAYAQPTLRGGRSVELALGAGTARLDAMDAAFVVASSAHCQDFDDTHFPSLTHPSAAPLGAALGAAALWGSSPRELSVAVAVGREITIRIGLVFDKRLGERGLNTSTIASAVGAAAAAAFLRPGHSAPAIAGALSLAAGVGAGTQEWAATGAANKWLQFGFAAANGLRAALTSTGETALAPRAIEGDAGMLRTHGVEHPDPSVLTDGLGSRWHGDEVVLKPYPYPNGSHILFDAIDADERLVGIRLREIEAVELEVSGYTEKLMCLPWEEKLRPATEYALRFSLPGLIALALANRAVGGGPFASSGASLADLAGTADLARRIRYRAYTDASGATPMIGAPGRVRVRMASGETIVASAPARTEPLAWDTRLTRREIRGKLLRNLGRPDAGSDARGIDVEVARAVLGAVCADLGRIEADGSALARTLDAARAVAS